MPTPDTPSSSPSQAATALGQLADETPDVMTLHTQDAYRMFTGRSADPVSKAPAIPGGRRFAAVLKSIWYLSANDNPYADWILIRVYQALVAIRTQMAQAIAVREAEFEALRRKGLRLSVLGSRSPATVSLGFRSPYGYATAEAIVEFDYHVRMVKTLVLKDRLSDDAGRAAIREVGRGLRRLFLEPIRWERNLLRAEMLPLEPPRFPARRRRGGATADSRRGGAVWRSAPRRVHRRRGAAPLAAPDHAHRSGAATVAAGGAEHRHAAGAAGTCRGAVAVMGEAPLQEYQPSAAELRMLSAVAQQAIVDAWRCGMERAWFRGYRIEARRLDGADGRSHFLVLTLGSVGGARVLDRVLIEVAPHPNSGSACDLCFARASAASWRTESLAGCVSPVDARYASPETGQIS